MYPLQNCGKKVDNSVNCAMLSCLLFDNIIVAIPTYFIFTTESLACIDDVTSEGVFSTWRSVISD